MSAPHPIPILSLNGGTFVLEEWSSAALGTQVWCKHTPQSKQIRSLIAQTPLLCRSACTSILLEGWSARGWQSMTQCRLASIPFHLQHKKCASDSLRPSAAQYTFICSAQICKEHCFHCFPTCHQQASHHLLSTRSGLNKPHGLCHLLLGKAKDMDHELI